MDSPFRHTMKKHDQFIMIFEGIDGAGKATLCKSVADHINKFKHNVTFKNAEEVFTEILTYQNRTDLKCEIHTFPDYTSDVGRAIADMLNWESLNVSQRKVLATLFALERKQRTIGPSINTIYIFDRYYPSNFCYNYEINDFDFLARLESESYVGDVVFILDVDPNVSFKRRPERRDSYEKDIKYLTNVRNKYLELARVFGWVVLDGSATTESLTRIVLDKITSMNHGLEYEQLA